VVGEKIEGDVLGTFAERALGLLRSRSRDEIFNDLQGPDGQQVYSNEGSSSTEKLVQSQAGHYQYVATSLQIVQIVTAPVVGSGHMWSIFRATAQLARSARSK
jgi:hypothetical protein